MSIEIEAIYLYTFNQPAPTNSMNVCVTTDDHLVGLSWGRMKAFVGRISGSRDERIRACVGKDSGFRGEDFGLSRIRTFVGRDSGFLGMDSSFPGKGFGLSWGLRLSWRVIRAFLGKKLGFGGDLRFRRGNDSRGSPGF